MCDLTVLIEMSSSLAISAVFSMFKQAPSMRGFTIEFAQPTDRAGQAV